jgi:uncharacterized protein
MTPKRLFLLLISAVTLVILGLALTAGLNRPQVQDRLQLAQTLLLLEASSAPALSAPALSAPDPDAVSPSSPTQGLPKQVLPTQVLPKYLPKQGLPKQGLPTHLPKQGLPKQGLREQILGKDPYQTAIQNYAELRKSLDQQLQQLEVAQQAQLAKQLQPSPSQPQPSSQSAGSQLPAPAAPASKLRRQTPTSGQLQNLRDTLQLEQGILEAKAGQLAQAQANWQALSAPEAAAPAIRRSAEILQGLWREPPSLAPDAESWLTQHLPRWFQAQSLERLYTLQGRSADLQQLRQTQQARATQSLLKLEVLIGLPALSSLIGVMLLLGLGVRSWWRDRRGLVTTLVTWSVPWNWETLTLGLFGGFFFVGQIFVSQILVASLFQGLQRSLGPLDIRGQALSIFLNYGLMAVSVLGVLYLLLRDYLPLEKPWFRFRGSWIRWGLGGYFVATPLVLVVSLVNQRFWQGQGGSNPLLTLALENQDGVALALFFTTAAIAAPLFEEVVFRGFVFPSLLRYVPRWGAIVLSALIFALAHLNPSEVLPLTMLGAVLAFVYSRTGNLLAPMLLHGLWNSSTLFNLYLLGSALS